MYFFKGYREFLMCEIVWNDYFENFLKDLQIFHLHSLCNTHYQNEIK
ncbi:hypothetical protein HCMG_01098 [Helicobacter canadensis MIT 98-5491]|nr:hypothetical protein HCMG_01098 [Helicobacter canadensis MIT 98-5491]